MKLSDKAYEILKWLCLICIPAVAVFISQVGDAIGIQNVDTVVLVLNAVGTLIGALIGVSTYQYRQENILYSEPKNGDTE
jgi:hypothetical protein